MYEWKGNHVNTPSIAEERWRIVDEGDGWTVWFIPQNHPELWQEVGEFATELQAVEYLKTL